MIANRCIPVRKWKCVVFMPFLFLNLHAQNNRDQGLRLFQEGYYVEAQLALGKYVIDHPGDGEAFYTLGRICSIHGEFEAAASYFEKAVEAKSDNSEYYSQLAMAYGQASGRAGLIEKIGYVRKTKTAALRAVELDPEYVPARYTLFVFYLRAPGAMGGDRKKAKEQADVMMTHDPVQGHLAWSEIHIEEKEYGKTYASYLEMLKLAKIQPNPSVSMRRIENLLNNLGYVFLRNGDKRKAIEILKNNTIEFPDSPNAWDSLAEACLSNGDTALAIDCYKKSVAMNPRNNINMERLFIGGNRALKNLLPKAVASNYVYRVPPDDGDGWPTGSLTDAGMDVEPLAEMMNHVMVENAHDLHSILIVKNGKLVFEEYFNGVELDVNEETLNSMTIGGDLKIRKQTFDRNTLQFLASVTKSITSALVGIAIDKGWIKGLDEKLFSFFPDYSEFNTGKKGDITIRDMLTMSSGFPWNEDFPYNHDMNNLNQMMEAHDPVRYVLGLDPFASPGKEFRYNSGTTVLLGEIVKRTSGMDLDDLAKKYLFSPLGIDSFQFMNFPRAKETFLACSMSWLRPRDMAKFGQLYLRKGMWDSKQIISKEWVERSFAPSVSLKRAGPWRAFTGYGFQWWMVDFDNKKINGIVAAGFGGQFIVILPALDMAVVFTAGDYGLGQPLLAYNIVNQYILSAVR